ncbi:hypothetical protein CTM53_00385 [Prevotella intermedia]|uniref:DUF308 domain-containing protein n=1 Tax=Prevotella intermedia TaxID=28131 RepID=A0AAJ3RRB7_PREIN|nr:DUF308 domain-containing protein [Prevotella intermedia]PJI19410.1 hypothetical protein CTM53_00385 [Prevotella intermedia]
MRLIQSFIIRAIVAIVIGALLVKYRVETMTWITIAAGILFFISGAISCTAYYFEKEKAAKVPPITDEKNNIVKANPPIFPIVGIGCAVLGIILTLMPNEFITWVVYIFAAILILGAVNQFMNLASSRQFARVPLLFWLFPSVTLGIGIYIIAQPMDAAALPLKVIGWCLMFYGVVELVNAIKINQMKRAYEKIENAKIVNGVKMPSDDKIEDAEIVEE